jgi:predicted DNA-binding ribbon-helix-helix protein
MATSTNTVAVSEFPPRPRTLPAGESRLVNRSITAETGRTSMRLEPELWAALEDICQRENLSADGVMRRIEQSTQATSQDGGKTGRKTGRKSGRTSAMRVFILTYFRAAATEAGHRLAGHGANRIAALSRAASRYNVADDARAPSRHRSHRRGTC